MGVHLFLGLALTAYNKVFRTAVSLINIFGM